MRIVSIFRKATQSRTRQQSSPFFSTLSRSFSLLSSQSQQRPSFGIAFDIDGVLLLGEAPIGGSPQALKRLYDDSGALKIPYVFLTNGGGFRESKRASELSKLLGVNVLPLQVLQGHSPFKQLADRFENELVVAAGKGEPAAVMSEYGFRNVLSIDEYASCFDNIDPLAQYKKWSNKVVATQNRPTAIRDNVYAQRVQAAFIVSDPIDWSRDIQVLCDILRTGGLPGREIGYQPHLYFASDDLEYQVSKILVSRVFAECRLSNELAWCLSSVRLNFQLNGLAWELSESHWKPSLIDVLGQLVPSLHHNLNGVNPEKSRNYCFKRLYMIGDNPSVDIKGAKQAGHPWFSILTRTGVFKGKGNHPEFRADLVVDSVEEAVEYILEKESL